MPRKNGAVWRLRGFDTFERSWYPLRGTYADENAALTAAHKRLEELERTQPSVDSGGQEPGGIQDQVHVVRPDGTTYRVYPEGV